MNNSSLSIMFPQDFEISNEEKPPKIYSNVLTNEKGISSYLYILLFYDKYTENEEDLQEDAEKLRLSSTSDLIKVFYCPISIIILSYSNNLDFFDKLLKEYYRIIKFNINIILNEKEIEENNIESAPPNVIENNNNNNNNNNIENNNNIYKKLLFYQKIELLNYLNYSYEILHPPNKTILNFNLRFSQIKYCSQSNIEIPTNEICIKILFNCLEISTIINLYIALLFEKYIILIGNQNQMLFCICEGLKKLLFPFRWLHTYVPILPKQLFNFLDSPSPYFFGIKSNLIDPIELNKQYPSHIICDINSSTIYGNVSSLKLPLNEELKIKKKLMLLKNKNINFYDDVIIDNVNFSNLNNKNIEFEDVDFSLSFNQNVQKIFFRIFKNNLYRIKKEYMFNNNNTFDSKSFLRLFDDNKEYKLFFDKIINTYAFEFFILYMHYFDDSNSRLFNLICKNNNKNLDNNNNYYNFEFSLFDNIFLDNNNNNNNHTEKSNNTNNNNDNNNNENNTNNNNDNNNNYKKFYFEISNLIEQNKEKKIKKNNFVSLPFYDNNNGFLHFISNYSNLISYKEVIMKEINHLFNELKENSIQINRINNKNINIPNNENNKSFFYMVLATYLIENINLEKNSNENNEFIFKMFVNSYEKNRIEFPRNIFYLFLDKLSTNQLNIFHNTKFNFINKSILFQRNKKEKIKNKLMVINTNFDSDDEDEESLSENDDKNSVLNNSKIYPKYKYKKLKTLSYKDINLNSILERKKNQKSSNKISLCKIDDKIIFDDEKYTKMKVNVIDGNKENDNNNNNNNEINFNNNNNNNNNKNNNNNNNNNKNKNNNNNIHNKNYSLFNINNKIIDNNNIEKNNNLNNDPLGLCEKICVSLVSFCLKVKIERYSQSFIDSSELRKLKDNDFFEITKLILSLKNISLNQLYLNKTYYYCFWLNLFNFLTIFSIIYKGEVCSSYFEWQRFLKNSYFSIGKFEISLYEIQTKILITSEVTKRIYGENIKYDIPNFKKYEPFDNIINYGISIPTLSSPSLRIYFPFNFKENLMLNANEFFSRLFKIDFQNIVIEMPEYLSWINPKFVKEINDYKNLLPKELINYIISNKNIIQTVVCKYDWKETFENFKNVSNF